MSERPGRGTARLCSHWSGKEKLVVVMVANWVNVCYLNSAGDIWLDCD